MHSAKESYEQIQALSDHRESLEHVWTHLLTEDKNILSQAQEEGTDEQADHMLSSLKSSNDKYEKNVNNQSNTIQRLVLAEESDQSTSTKPLRNPQSSKEDVVITEKLKKKIASPPKESAKAINSGQVVQFSSEIKESLNKQMKTTYQHNNEEKIPVVNEQRTKSGKLKLRLVKTTIEHDKDQGEEEEKTLAKRLGGSSKLLSGSDDISKSITIPSSKQPIPLLHSSTLQSSQKRKPFFKMSAGISRIKALFSKSITDKGSGVIIILLNAWRFASNLKKRSTSWSRNTVSPFQADLIDDIAQVNSLEAPGKWKKMKQLIQPTIHQQSSLTRESSLRQNSFNSSSSSNSTSSMLINCQVRFFQWIWQILESLPIINPQSQYLYVWDSIHLLFIVLTILVKPIELVTMTHMAEEYNNSILWSIFPMICLFVFSLDVVFNFNTGFYQCGMCIMERNQVMMNYLRKGVLWDLLAILPILDSIFSIDGTWRIVNVFILFKYATMRGILAKYLELFQLQNEIVISTFIKLMKVGTLVLFQAHLFGCLFLGLAVLEDTYNLVDLNWIVRYSKIQQTAQTPDQWLENRSVFSKYFYSFYWSVTTMTTTGYGDILPANNYEAIFTAFSMIIAGGVFAYSFNSIGIIVQEMDKRNQEFQHDLRLISKYLQNNNIKRSLQIEATKYIEYKHRAEKELSMKEEKEVLEKLGQNIGSKVTTSANIQLIKVIPFLVNNFSKRFLRKLALCFEKQTFLNNEIVFEEDDCKAPNSSYQFFANQASSNIPKGPIQQQQQQLSQGQMMPQYAVSNSPEILASSSPKPGPIFVSPGYKQFQPQHPSGFSGNLNTKKLSFSSQHIPIPQLSSQNQSYAGGNTTNHRNIQQQRQIPSATPSVRAGAQAAQGFEGYIQQYQQQQQLSNNMSQRGNALISLAVPNTAMNTNNNTYQFEDYYQQLSLNPSSSVNSETAFYIVERGQIQLFTYSQKQVNNDCIKPIKELKKADFFGELSFFSDKPRCCSARSIGASSVLSIKKKDFLKLLKEFPLDYEMFCQLRDEVSVNDDISSLSIHCHSCGALGHTSFKCSKVHFQPDRESAILKQKFKDSVKQLNRDNSYLRKNEKYNCLLNSRDIKSGQERLKEGQIFVQNQGSGGGSSRGILVTPCKQGSQRIIAGNKAIPPLPLGSNRDWCSQDQQFIQKRSGKIKQLQKLYTQPSIQESHEKSQQNIHKPLSQNNIYLVDEAINNHQHNNNDLDSNMTPSRFKKENMILEEENERESYKENKRIVQWEEQNGRDQREQLDKQGSINNKQSHFRKHNYSQPSIRVIDKVTSIGLINDLDNNQLDLCSANQENQEDNQLNRINLFHRETQKGIVRQVSRTINQHHNSQNYLEDQQNLGQNQKVSLNELAAAAGENLNESESSSSSNSSQRNRKSRILGQQQQQQDIDQDNNSSDDSNSNQIQKQRLFPVKGKLNSKMQSTTNKKLKSSVFTRIDELKAIRRNLQHQSSLENRNIQKTLLLQHIQDTLKQLEDLEQGIITSTEDQDEKEEQLYKGKINFTLGGSQDEADDSMLKGRNSKEEQDKGFYQYSRKDTIVEFPSMNTDRMKSFKQYFPLNNCENVLKSMSQLKPHYFNRRNRIYHIYNRDTIKPMYQGRTIDIPRKQRTTNKLTKIASAVINSNAVGQKNQTNASTKTAEVGAANHMRDNSNRNSNAAVINPILQVFTHHPPPPQQQNKLSFFMKSSSKTKNATFTSDESF